MEAPEPLPPGAPDPEADLIAFTLTLGRALHRYGTPAHRLEAALQQLLANRNVPAQFFALPTALLATFGDPPAGRSHLLRMDPGEVDLEKLVRVDAVAGKVHRGEVSPGEGLALVWHIMETRSRYPWWLQLVCWPAVSAAAAVFFDGGAHEVVVAAALGLGVGLLALLAGKAPPFARVLEATAACLVTVGAMAAALAWGPVSTWITALAGIIVLIPGLGLTTAMTELATRNLVCGATRLAGAALSFVQLGLGMAVGTRIGALLLGDVKLTARVLPLHPLADELATLVAPLCFAVLFQARPRDIPWILGTGILAVWGSRAGGLLLGPELGTFAGALAVGLAANLYTRWRDRPGAVLQVPGIMMLVPGGMGLRGIISLLREDVISGLDTGFSAVVVAITLASGLLVANALIHPKKEL